MENFVNVIYGEKKTMVRTSNVCEWYLNLICTQMNRGVPAWSNANNENTSITCIIIISDYFSFHRVVFLYLRMTHSIQSTGKKFIITRKDTGKKFTFDGKNNNFMFIWVTHSRNLRHLGPNIHLLLTLPRRILQSSWISLHPDPTSCVATSQAS